jgi:hypothetical protein
MIVDPASAAIYSQQKEPVIPELAREQPKPQPPAAQTAQTHAAGPAVVANFSAAALLTNRAVSAPLQPADQERVKEEGKKAGPAPRRQPEEAPERGSRLDVKI